MTFAPLPCHLIRNPAGTYHFVGRVPDALAFVSSDPAYTAAAKQCGPGIAARIATAQGGTFRTLSWATEADAYAAAAALGYAVPQTAECDAAIAAIETGLVASGAIDAPAMVPQQVQQQQGRDARHAKGILSPGCIPERAGSTLNEGRRHSTKTDGTPRKGWFDARCVSAASAPYLTVGRIYRMREARNGWLETEGGDRMAAFRFEPIA